MSVVSSIPGNIFPPLAWSGSTANSNFLRQSYINGFLDVSNEAIFRTDASMCGNVGIGGAVSIQNNIGMSGVINQLATIPLNGGYVYQQVNSQDSLTAIAQVAVLNTLVVAGNGLGNPVLAYANPITGNSVTIGSTTVNPVLGGISNYSRGNLIVISDTSLNSRLFVGGDVSMNGRLSIATDISVNGLSIGLGSRSVATNTMVGTNVLQGLTNVYGYNTGLGYNALTAATTSINDTAVGALALNSNTSGVNNTAVGYGSGAFVTTGGNITCVGANTGFSSSVTQYSQSTALGYNATITANNQIVLGTAAESTVNPGKVAVGSAALPSYTLDVTGTGRFTSDVSINGNLVVAGTIAVQQLQNKNIINTTTTNYQLIVSEDLSLNGRLLVSGDASLNGRLYVSNNLSIGMSAVGASLTGSYPTYPSQLDIGGNILSNGITTSSPLCLSAHTALGGGSTFAQMTIRSNAGDYGNQTLMLSGGGSYPNGSGILQAKDLYRNSAIRLLLNPDGGNVGIGTTAPAYQLDVSAGTGTKIHSLYINAQSNNGTMALGAAALQTAGTFGSGFALYQGTGGDTVLNAASGQTIGFKINNNSISTINSTGLGIGTTNPTFPLHITNAVAFNNSGNSMYLYNAAQQVYSGGARAWGAVSIYAVGAIFTQDSVGSVGGYSSGCDIRIKKNIKDIDENVALTKLRQIQPKLYNYKDVYKRGDQPVYGFIAQEVADIIPYSVTKSKSYIPNIYEIVTIQHDIVTLNKTSTLLFENDLSGNPIKVKFYDDSDKEIIRTIEAIIDEKRFKINESIDMARPFLYGQEINDFNYLEKDAIFTITTAAVKQIDSIVQTQQQTIQTQQTQIQDLKSRLNALEARLTAAGF